MPNQAYRWSPVESLPDIPASPGRPGVWRGLLKDFLASGKPYAKLDTNGHKVSSMVPQLSRTARMHNLPVKIHRRGTEVYLARAKSS